jgi:hypothetical protein
MNLQQQQQERGKKEEKKTFEIPLASVVFFASSGVGSKTNTSDRSSDESYESILQSLRAVADASDEIFGNVEKEIDRLVSKALEMDGRVRRCERKIAEAQRRYYACNNNNNNNSGNNVGGGEGEEDLLVLESSRKYVVVADDEKDGAKQRTTTRRMMYYDDEVRNAIQRANENRPKRRAFKDVENMAMRARRYGESARALARSLMKGDGKSAVGESEADHERLDREDNASSRKLGGNRAHARFVNRKGSLADVMPAKTAFYDCEALRFGGKAKDGDGENEEEEEVSRDGDEKVGDLSDGFAKKLLLSSPPPKSIVPPEIVRSVRMPDADVNANTSSSGGNDDGRDANVMSAKKSLESVFSFRPKASEAPVVVFPGTLPSTIPSASKSATGEQRKEGFGGSDVYEFTLTSENPYSPSAFLRNPQKKKAPSSRKKKSSTPTNQKSSVRSSNNSTIAINRQAPSSSPSPPPPPPPPPPASNNSRQEVRSPAADDGGRGALMEAIRRGAKLRKVSVSTERDAPRASNASDVDDTTDNSAAEGDKAKTPNASRGGSAQMRMMEELANQLRRRRSTVVSSQKKQ